MAFVTRRMTPLLLALALLSPNVRAAEPPTEQPIDLTPRVGANDFAEVTIELEVRRHDAGPRRQRRTNPKSGRSR